MKIKYWLMISYLVVMVLPMVAVYLLYISLSNYDQKQDLQEFLHFQEIVADLESELQDVSLYQGQPKENYRNLISLTDDHLKIDLYRSDGLHLFSSMNTLGTGQFQWTSQENLFRNLNEFQKNPRTYTMKQLVFDEQNQPIGLYEITLSRSKWVEATSTRTNMMFILLAGFFLIFYIIVLLAINRKLNQPLNQLQQHMKAFADGKKPTKPLAQPKDEIGVLIHHFEQMKAQIMETNEALRKQQREKEYMVASLSHDLKTPLTAVRAYTEALENHHLTEKEQQEYRHILYEKLDHMKEMINDLSVFTALQSAENRLNKVSVNGNEFFEMLFTGYEEACASKQITLTTEIAVKNGYMLDPKQMVRLLDNLMDNAVRYTPSGKQIWLAGISAKNPLPEWVFRAFRNEVDTWREDGTVILIQNEGKGMKQNQLTNVFQPFYQNESSRGKGSTSGLGLSIAKMIMEKHDGKIKIWSTEDKGTLIACWLKERGS
ncbi:HAMP domain-containing sensor histidine kinase [Oceanobacillus indicireducens]|uniref:histidine kinase n=1 Tax=Oceanobacillus indicireducens TaxID=1004261 RepID=A0A917Y4D8_9BACI|nr:HAMP domain-containing sensor histidine kinase [Oceanobacillus indicireducens]GGN65167.1 hypothetical protein GCM10007971_33760 [Oceanobacillus indicireducens]